jgi:hypothetical protein
LLTFANSRSPFDFAQGRLSTPLRSGRDDTIYLNHFGLRTLARGGDPEGVRVEEKEENHAEGHEIHVDEEEDAAVVEAPAPLHATNGVRGAGGGGEDREDEDGCAVDLREAGDGDGCEQTDQDKQDAA